MDGHRPPNFVAEFQHVAVLVSDLDTSKAWCRELLGWEELFAGEMPNALGDLNGFSGLGGEIAMGSIRGVRVELVQMRTRVPLGRWVRGRYGLFVLSVRLNDLEAARERCAELGVAVVGEGQLASVTTLFVRDPDGQEVALVGPRPEAGPSQQQDQSIKTQSIKGGGWATKKLIRLSSQRGVRKDSRLAHLVWSVSQCRLSLTPLRVGSRC